MVKQNCDQPNLLFQKCGWFKGSHLSISCGLCPVCMEQETIWLHIPTICPVPVSQRIFQHPVRYKSFNNRIDAQSQYVAIGPPYLPLLKSIKWKNISRCHIFCFQKLHITSPKVQIAGYLTLRLINFGGHIVFCRPFYIQANEQICFRYSFNTIVTP